MIFQKKKPKIPDFANQLMNKKTLTGQCGGKKNDAFDFSFKETMPQKKTRRSRHSRMNKAQLLTDRA